MRVLEDWEIYKLCDIKDKKMREYKSGKKPLPRTELQRDIEFLLEVHEKLVDRIKDQLILRKQ